MCLLVVLIGRLGRHGTGLVRILNEVPAAIEYEFGPHAVQCESQAPPDLLEKDGLARPVVDIDELELPIGEFRGDQVDDDVECAGQLFSRTKISRSLAQRYRSTGLRRQLPLD